jgi:tripartite-type tricarboxylate transporter receptor subunit TctC
MQNVVRVAILAALVSVSVPAALGAQDYPNRPIRIVIPVTAGGLMDVLARLVGERLQAKWGQPIIVEARPGGSGNVGAEVVARAGPDGYTMLISAPPPLAMNHMLFRKLGFDPAAFVPVTVIAAVPNVLVVRPNLPVSDFQGLIAYAKSNPDKLSYASTGSGSTPHLSAEMLKLETGIRMVHVPYRGVPPAFTDLIGAQVDLMFANLGDSWPHIKSGRVKVLATGSQARLAALPNVPAVSELMSGLVSETWYALVAPPETPTRIVETLSMAVVEALRTPEVVKRTGELSAKPIGLSPSESAAFIKDESQRWGRIIALAGIKPE